MMVLQYLKVGQFLVVQHFFVIFSYEFLMIFSYDSDL